MRGKSFFFLIAKSSDVEQKVQNSEKRIPKIDILPPYESISFTFNLLWSNWPNPILNKQMNEWWKKVFIIAKSWDQEQKVQNSEKRIPKIAIFPPYVSTRSPLLGYHSGQTSLPNTSSEQLSRCQMPSWPKLLQKSLPCNRKQTKLCKEFTLHTS